MQATGVGNMDMSSWSKRFSQKGFLELHSYLICSIRAPLLGRWCAVPDVRAGMALVEPAYREGGYHNSHHLMGGGVQGFPARSHTVMHSAILDYLPAYGSGPNGRGCSTQLIPPLALC